MQKPEFWYLLIILSILLASGAWRLLRPTRHNVLSAVTWLGILSVIMVIYVLRDELADVPQRLQAEFLSKKGVENSEGIRYSRNPNGQVIVEVVIDHTPITMLLDTGASAVMLQKRDAERLGIHPQAEEFVYPVQTAGGVQHMARIRLPSVQIGSMLVPDVGALVSQENTGISLLGMTALSHFDMRFSGHYVQLSPK